MNSDSFVIRILPCCGCPQRTNPMALDSEALNSDTIFIIFTNCQTCSPGSTLENRVQKIIHNTKKPFFSKFHNCKQSFSSLKNLHLQDAIARALIMAAGSPGWALTCHWDVRTCETLKKRKIEKFMDKYTITSIVWFPLAVLATFAPHTTHPPTRMHRGRCGWKTMRSRPVTNMGGRLGAYLVPYSRSSSPLGAFGLALSFHGSHSLCCSTRCSRSPLPCCSLCCFPLFSFLFPPTLPYCKLRGSWSGGLHERVEGTPVHAGARSPLARMVTTIVPEGGGNCSMHHHGLFMCTPIFQFCTPHMPLTLLGLPIRTTHVSVNCFHFVCDVTPRSFCLPLLASFFWLLQVWLVCLHVIVRLSRPQLFLCTPQISKHT